MKVKKKVANPPDIHSLLKTILKLCRLTTTPIYEDASSLKEKGGKI